jgi:hypothetical protein
MSNGLTVSSSRGTSVGIVTVDVNVHAPLSIGIVARDVP